tara:strand:+ start:729 stop:959 length:231 start_codon:yes stop_codon:yes gene_type:complete
MPRGKASEYVKAPITIVFSTSNRSNAKIKMKTVRNRTIDDLIDCNYVIPGIPAKAIIKEVGIGNYFIEKYKKKYGL